MASHSQPWGKNLRREVISGNAMPPGWFDIKVLSGLADQTLP